MSVVGALLCAIAQGPERQIATGSRPGGRVGSRTPEKTRRRSGPPEAGRRSTAMQPSHECTIATLRPRGGPLAGVVACRNVRRQAWLDAFRRCCAAAAAPHDEEGGPITAADSEYPELVPDAIRVCRRCRPQFGRGTAGGGSGSNMSASAPYGTQFREGIVRIRCIRTPAWRARMGYVARPVGRPRAYCRQLRGFGARACGPQARRPQIFAS